MTDKCQEMGEHDHPLDDVMKTAMQVLRDGGHVHQKYTCQNCKQRWTLAEQDIFFDIGECPECNHKTNINKYGCNYVAVFKITAAKDTKH